MPTDLTERKQIEQELQERLKFEQLLCTLSTTFINLPASEVDKKIEQGLKLIVEFLDIDRSSVGQFAPDGTSLIVTHSYAVPGIPALPTIVLNEQLPWYTKALRGGKGIVLERLPDDLPDEAVLEKQYVQQMGIKSQLAISLKVGGAILGAVGFASFRRQRAWPEDLIRRLSLVGEIFSNALERKRAELEEQKHREELAHVLRIATMGELAASLAHELNQPLTVILSNARAAEHLLAGNPPDLGEVRAALADIVEDDKRADGVIRRLRALLQKHELERSPLEINDVIQEVIPLVRSNVLRDNIKLTFKLTTALPPVLGDRIQLQQVLLNLILNGLEAMRHPPCTRKELVVRTAQADPHTITVSIRDFGIGLDPTIVERIFDPFFTTKTGGMGMGLAISQSIIKAHGGQLWVTSNPDRGATFHFTMPVAREIPA